LLLKIGSSGPDVKTLQDKLASLGFFRGINSGIFNSETEEAIKQFQVRHIGPDKQFLDPDGIVGPATAWALEHHSGDDQCNFLDPEIPEGLSPLREQTLRIARAEWKKGVRETSNNWGLEISKYGGRAGWSWCCLFVTWCWRQAGVQIGKEPSTFDLWMAAIRNGWFYPLESKEPIALIPGNALLFQHQSNGHWTRTGHISLIARVGSGVAPIAAIGAPKAQEVLGMQFNTFGGNEGNRVKFGIRSDKSKDLIGFINPFPPDEQPLDFERGIILNARSVENDTTR